MSAHRKWTIHHFDTVDSTNTRAFELAGGNTVAPFWVRADRQVAGRGRRDRHWVSEPGNLFASIYLPQVAAVERLHELPFLTTVALYEAVSAKLGGLGPQLTIKWPNDLLYAGAKISGILIESRSGQDGKADIVIGFGVNCRHHPPTTDYPATDLTEITGRPVNPDDVFTALGEALGDRLADWRHGNGFAEIRQRWLRAAHPIGTALTIHLSGSSLSGRFGGLDDAGQLILRQPDGRSMIIAAGDVAIVGQFNE